MKRNSTLVCKVLLTALTIFSLNFNTEAQIAKAMPVANSSLVLDNTTVNQYEFPSIAPGIDAFITVSQVNADKSINIKWITEFEQGNDHFEIERSFDNIHFKTVAIVLDGFLTGDVQKTFMFRDKAAALNGKKMVYYRLKQVDPSGKGTTTRLLSINLNLEKPGELELAPARCIENLYVRTILSKQSVNRGV